MHRRTERLRDTETGAAAPREKEATMVEDRLALAGRILALAVALAVVKAMVDTAEEFSLPPSQISDGEETRHDLC